MHPGSHGRSTVKRARACVCAGALYLFKRRLQCMVKVMSAVGCVCECVCVSVCSVSAAAVVQGSLDARRLATTTAAQQDPRKRSSDSHQHQMYAPDAVLFCSLAVLDPRVGHSMDILSPFISVLCHSDWLFHGESCPRLDVVHTSLYYCFFVYLVINPRQETSTVAQDKYSFKSIKHLCGLNGQHRAVPLTCSQNVNGVTHTPI